MSNVFKLSGAALLIASAMPLASFAAPWQDQPGSRTIKADQTKNDPTDQQIARNVKRDLAQNKTLSASGHSVKVVVQDGRITIRGPVRNDTERKKIIEIAEKYSNGGHVVDQMILASGGK
jgi:osmotically-inducible protein OsmY